MTDQDYDLDRAYEIDGADSARDLYKAWADTYDEAFAADWGYVAPRRIAEIFREEMGAEDVPVLDLGAGTGLVAEHLRDLVVDGIDLTAEMLDRAGEKGLYRRRIVGDLTQTLEMEDASYGGFISSGTFTHGHVGPVCFPELLRVARPGALFCCGAIASVLDAAGFGSALAQLVARGRIEPVRFREFEIYENATHSHAGDLGLVMVFRRL